MSTFTVSCLIVRVFEPTDLPRPSMAERYKPLFGFNPEYRSPYRPKFWDESANGKIGFYNITGPLILPTCDINPELFDTFVLWKGTKEAAQHKLAQIGWNQFLKEAEQVFEIHEGKVLGAAA